MKNVIDYGAKANGVVNDTIAIQKADKGGRAVFPAGTYVVGNLVLENPPVFEGFVQFRPADKCDFVIKFSTDNQRPHEPVQGSFYVNLYRDKMVYKEKITGVIIEGGGWFFPKISINGNNPNPALLKTNKTGLKITDQGDDHKPATHNHIGFLGIIGCNSNVLFDVDESSYAKNNLITHSYLKSNNTVNECDSAIKYIYRGGANYSSNKFNQAYIEGFDNGIDFARVRQNLIPLDSNNFNPLQKGVAGDWFDVHFDDISTHIKIDSLQPYIFIINRNIHNHNLEIETTNGGSGQDVIKLHEEL